jgi:SAM-dependent methyltransferase
MPGLRRAGGQSYDAICREIRFSSKNYFGIEWNHASIRPGRHRELNIIRGDLNSPLPYRDRTFACVFALSVLEHLTNGCRFILECRQVLQLNGRLVLLTPNISTFFSIVQLLLGKMPSSGPPTGLQPPGERRKANSGERYRPG